MFVAIQPGTIHTVAGNGDPAYAGDGGLAASASLNEPKHVALDEAGRLYIADSENHVIRCVDLSTGIIVTIAGSQEAGAGPTLPSPAEATDSVPPAAEEDPLGGPTHAETERMTQSRDLSGTVRFLAGSATVKRYGGDGGPAVRAVLNFPGAVAIDAHGHLYIADTMNHRVRMVDASTGMIRTIAGTGQRRYAGDGGPAMLAALNEPTALALDTRGSLYVADQGNHRVRRIDLATGDISTLAGVGEGVYNGDGMPASEAGLSGPSGLAMGRDQILYIADTFNGRIRSVDLGSGLIDTVAGDGGDYRYQGEEEGRSVSISRPYGIALAPDGDLMLTDSDNHMIRRWDRRSRTVSRVAGNGAAGYRGDGGLPEACALNYPFGVAVDRHGNVFIADTFNHRVRMVAAS